MDKFISGYCVGGCGEMITEDSGFVTILKNGDLLCDYCRDEETPLAALRCLFETSKNELTARNLPLEWLSDSAMGKAERVLTRNANGGCLIYFGFSKNADVYPYTKHGLANGLLLRELFVIPRDSDLWMVNRDGGDDKRIELFDVVTIKDGERFYSAAKKINGA